MAERHASLVLPSHIYTLFNAACPPIHTTHPSSSLMPVYCAFLAGNIIGSLIAASMLKHGWGWSFVVPGAFIALCGAWRAQGQVLWKI